LSFNFSDVGAEMKAEEIIRQIVSTCPWITREHVLKRLEKEKHKTGGFISDETLLRMIAAEFGCTVSKSETPVLSLLLRDLLPGLNDVTVVGRVLAAFPSKTFERIKKGKFASMLIADKSCSLRVILWNDKASLFESGRISIGQVVRFSHGYTREDRSGKVELHVGEKCEVEANPQDVETRDYPSIGKFSTRIGELTKAHKNMRVNIIGTVKRTFPKSAFKREDSSEGKVMRFVLSDQTGEIPIVVWNEKVDELENALGVDARLQIVNAKVKKALGEGLEIHVDATTYIGPLAQAEEFLNIADLREGMSRANVEGEVATKPVIREVKTSKEELLKLATFELKDETGTIWVSAWRNLADTAGNMRVGDKIIIKNAYVKKGFADQLELSTRTTTSITIIQ
jgi:ssDNA-binding replication factor A large subunit